MDLPKTRAEAIARGLTRYFTGEPCKHGHVVWRSAASRGCSACQNENSKIDRAKHGWKRVAKKKDWYEANKERVLEKSKLRHRDNYATEAGRAKVKARVVAWQKANPEKTNAKCRIHYARNLEKQRLRHRVYRRTNKPKINAATRQRQAQKLNSTPTWLTPAQNEQMLAIYEQCALISELTGVKHHVDHIEPLQGEDRCGLHVPWNLQVLEARENIAKGNRVERKRALSQFEILVG